MKVNVKLSGVNSSVNLGDACPPNIPTVSRPFPSFTSLAGEAHPMIASLDDLRNGRLSPCSW